MLTKLLVQHDPTHEFTQSSKLIRIKTIIVNGDSTRTKSMFGKRERKLNGKKNRG